MPAPRDTAPHVMLAMLPVAVRNRLEELLASLRRGLGEDLCAVLVYGSAVRGGFRPGRSDVDVLVVVRTDAPGRLADVAPAVRLARAAARIECMFLRADEIPRAADVFPLLFDDVRGCHVALWGIDPFASLTIDDEHRRLRVEQELRDLRIRLRRVQIDATDDEALRAPLARQVRLLRSPLHALLSLRGIVIDDDIGSVLGAASRRFDVLTSELLPLVVPRVAAGQLQALLDAAITDVDSLVPGARNGAAEQRG